jgi:ABC-type Fe3+/spermidine/putrescine transport system ATPase subunit
MALALGRTAAKGRVLPVAPARQQERAHIPDAEGTHVDQHCNVVRARVDELVYCGDHHRVHLTLGSRDAIVVKVPNTQRHALPAPGDVIQVAWRHGDNALRNRRNACRDQNA